MRTLVTGGTGFLGRRVVAELLRRGHAVRVIVRPSSRLDHLSWEREVDVYRADLRTGDLAAAFNGVETLVHLAATVAGDEDTQFAATVNGTERLLEAMAGSATRRLVLVSSFAVYAWANIQGILDEKSPVEEGSHLYARDSYTIAKVWQERVARREAEAHGWELTVLRPGFIWGKGGEYFAALGHRIGTLHLVIGPRTRLPLTHVDNCAHLLATATEHPRAAGETFNVVDSDDVRAWEHLGEHLKRSGERGLRVPIPFYFGLVIVQLFHLANLVAFRGKAKLPSILVSRRFQSRFKSLRFSNRKALEVLGWMPPFDRDECLRRTYPCSTSSTLDGRLLQAPGQLTND